MTDDHLDRLRAWRQQLNDDHRAWYERNGHPVPEPLHPADEEVPCHLGCGTDLRGPNGEHLPLLLADLDAAVAELERLRKDVAKLGEHVAPVNDREPMDVNDAAEELYTYVEQSSAPGQFRNRIRAVLDSRQSWRYRAFKLEGDVEQLRAQRDSDVQAVAEACAGMADGTPPQPIRHEYAVRRLRARFADRIAAVKTHDAKAGE